jgi:hypothetical protein
VTNPRDARVDNVRVLLRRIRRFSPSGSTLDDYQATMPLKWRYGDDRERRVARNLEARSVTIVNFGFLIRGYGFFQLDIAEDPWPRGFPARLDHGQRMLVDILTEGDDVPEAQPLSLDISWDGSWHDDTVQMQQHLTIRETRGD